VKSEKSKVVKMRKAETNDEILKTRNPFRRFFVSWFVSILSRFLHFRFLFRFFAFSVVSIFVSLFRIFRSFAFFLSLLSHFRHFSFLSP